MSIHNVQFSSVQQPLFADSKKIWTYGSTRANSFHFSAQVRQIYGVEFRCRLQHVI